jgi:hypothetical protein
MLNSDPAYAFVCSLSDSANFAETEVGVIRLWVLGHDRIICMIRWI